MMPYCKHNDILEYIYQACTQDGVGVPFLCPQVGDDDAEYVVLDALEFIHHKGGLQSLTVIQHGILVGAIRFGRFDIVKFIMDTVGYRPSTHDLSVALFDRAISHGHVDILQFLLDKIGVNGQLPEVRANYMISVEQAIFNGHLEMVQFISGERFKHHIYMHAQSSFDFYLKRVLIENASPDIRFMDEAGGVYPAPYFERRLVDKGEYDIVRYLFFNQYVDDYKDVIVRGLKKEGRRIVSLPFVDLPLAEILSTQEDQEPSQPIVHQSNIVEAPPVVKPEPEVSSEQYERKVGKFKYSRKMIIGRWKQWHSGCTRVCGVTRCPVAIKQMNKEFNILIDKEVDILIQLTALSTATDNLVRFFGMEENDDFIFLATSLCEMSLQELVETHQYRFQSLNKHSMIKDIINGVLFLHNNNIIHNDLNPRNILFKDNHLFITDMGLSKMSVETSFAFTHAPSGHGGYFPAEVINNQRKTNSVDIFALGCLMYYILTDGGHPFGDKVHLRVSKILNNKCDIKKLSDQPCASDLIKQMIAKDSSARPTINMVIHHPFFWDINKRILFINRLFQTTQNQPHFYLSFFPWNKSIDSMLLDQLKSQYDYKSTKDLIRCIRNTIQHHHELFKDAHKTLFFDSQQSAFQYFEQRHPTLIVQLYRRFINTVDAQSENLKDYFVVS
ncbi:hypothetical protein SAMD00019534_036070 [Acytostelium subglobosum LB1]|uniref:hypothetical protein n=1 Tax=Acytostelium subglobosum LB1 TaxID=1410327 RepID=UPI000644F391|nr:hypothetical protein SAMD00019534_036070 [Acytostelium subglobosum LB1]GAM20432.1 hypothetical protein SAMD00019534_036070 [Acytostelium subglobosum LB1]|eukprot:XP_012759953.1 hypothetical protein SAMD00019534_036070 [Acytostelium subglobosum LB1]